MAWHPLYFSEELFCETLEIGTAAAEALHSVNSSEESEMLKEGASLEASPVQPEECAGCGGRILDRFYLLAVDRPWHGSCLRCCECRQALDSELSCFHRDGKIYCKEDYYRLFSVTRCSRCSVGITANEMVMRARDKVYHLSCFSCFACHVPLTKGDTFVMKDALVYCHAHCSSSFEDYCGDDAILHKCQEFSGEVSPSQFYSSGSSLKGRPRKRKPAHHPDDILTMRMASNGLEIMHRGELSSSMESLSYESSIASPSSMAGHHSQRAKRMRTSFKHHQLRTMKSYFAVNQNPDAKDLKQLAQKTGLSKRVLQVWFQNARAKWRRNMMRQDPSQQGPSTPINMVIANNIVSNQSAAAHSHLTADHQQSMEDIQAGAPQGSGLTFSELY